MLLSVQCLRGLASILVVIFHAIHKQSQISGISGSWDFGMSGVDLFFIISGFIMCHVTARKEATAIEFLCARAKRILPLYWALTLVALAVYLVNPRMVNSSGGVTSVLNSFILIPNGEKFLIENGWTLSYEFLFYLIFAVAIWFPTEKRIAAVVTSLLTLTVAGAALRPSNPTVQFATNPLILEFALGASAYLYVSRPKHYLLMDAFLVIIGLIGLVVGMARANVDHRILYFGLPYALAFAGFVSFESALQRMSASWIAKGFAAIGDASYALYLSHPFVLSAAALVINRLHIHPPAMFDVGAMVITSVLVGHCCHRWLEKGLAHRIGSLSGSGHRIAPT